MTPQVLLQHFDRIGEAPDAIPRLRRFILDLAVRGKLVEQDPRDEPASELLKRIQAIKASLVKEGKNKKEKPFSSITEDDFPFPVSFNWSWSQFAEVGFINPRNTAEDDLPTSFVPMPLISAEYGVLAKHEVRPWAEIKSGYTHFAEGDVALAKITPCFENGKSTVFRKLTGGIGSGTTELHVVRPIIISAEYILIFLKCPYFIESGIPRMTGTAGQKRVPTEYFAYSPFPLPPLAEQHRIVAKVDELMDLCDRLEAAQTERESRRDRLVASSLHHLNNGADADAFQEHARFYFNYLPRLTTRPDHIKQLRQTILNLAVRGKLVPQDPNGEPVSTSAIPKDKPDRDRAGREESESVDYPFELPISWSWFRLGNISDQVTDGEHATPPRIEEHQVPLVTAKNVRDGFMDYSKTDWVSLDTARKAWVRCRPTVGDVLLVCVGATTGRLCVLREPRDMVLVRSVALIRPSILINVDFLALALRSPMCQNQIWKKVKVTAQPCLYIHRINSLAIPLPPFVEQPRIVAKVDELMALCDQIETQLTTTQSESRHLLEAVLHEALNPTLEKLA
jgi:type I restriction enzyme, S subunit